VPARPGAAVGCAPPAPVSAGIPPASTDVWGTVRCRFAASEPFQRFPLINNRFDFITILKGRTFSKTALKQRTESRNCLWANAGNEICPQRTVCAGNGGAQRGAGAEHGGGHGGPGAAGGELRTRAPPLALAQKDFGFFFCVRVRETMWRGAGRSGADPRCRRRRFPVVTGRAGLQQRRDREPQCRGRGRSGPLAVGLQPRANPTRVLLRDGAHLRRTAPADPGTAGTQRSAKRKSDSLDFL